MGYYAAVIVATAVAGVEFAVAADKWSDEVSRRSPHPYSAGPGPSSLPPPPQGFAPHLVVGCRMSPEAVVAVMRERCEVIRNAEPPPPQREKTWRRRMGEAAVGSVGLVGVGQAFQTGRYRSHAVTSRTRSGHPIATPVRFEMAALWRVCEIPTDLR